jgi:hypothetical protein
MAISTGNQNIHAQVSCLTFDPLGVISILLSRAIHESEVMNQVLSFPSPWVRFLLLKLLDKGFDVCMGLLVGETPQIIQIPINNQAWQA